MDINKHSFIDYRRTVAANKEIFLLKFPNILVDFLKTDDYCTKLTVSLTKGQLSTGKTLVSFVPLTSLLQRQLRNAFEAFAAAQSYQGWVLLRPALESALIMGKWSDDRKFADLWMNRDKNRKAYAREYSGPALESKSLPHSREIRVVLSRINDDFMHLNEGYYLRHSSLSPVDYERYIYKIGYFDADTEQEYHLHAFMHLSVVVLQSIAQMLDNRLENRSGVTVDVEGFRKAYGPTVEKLRRRDPVRARVLLELGLWPNPPVERTR